MSHLSASSSISKTYGADFPIEPLLSTISQADESEKLKETIDHCHIEINNCPSLAQCDLSSRTIVLDPSLFENPKPNQPQALASLAFELFNLSQEKEFRSLQNRAKELTADKFVEEFEAIEYKSALETKRIVRKIFPPQEWVNAPFAFTPDNFKDHYLLQQMKGHSRQIFERNASLLPPNSSYRGDDWGAPLDPQEIPFLSAYFDLKARSNDLLASISVKAKEDLQFLRHHIHREAGKGSKFFLRLYNHLFRLEHSLKGNAPLIGPAETDYKKKGNYSRLFESDSKDSSTFSLT